MQGFAIFAYCCSILMKKITSILLILFIVSVFMQCKKETEDWVFCNCGIDSWVGEYAGNGNYYKDEEVDAETVNVQVNIEQISSKNLTISVIAPEAYSQTFYGIKDDSTYYLTINGSNKSLIMNLKKKGNELKLIGTAKNFHWETNDDSTFLVTDKTLAFDVLQQP